jgi:hypothetical protein
MITRRNDVDLKSALDMFIPPSARFDVEEDTIPMKSEATFSENENDRTAIL